MKSPFRIDSYRRGLAIFALVSFVSFSSLVYLHPSQYGDLAGRFTDHLHHAHATWAFFKTGLDVYRLPFGIVGNKVDYPHPAVTWPEFSIPYPPGMFVVFLVPTLVGRYWPMSEAAFGKVCIIYLVAIAHIAVYAIGLTVRAAPGSRLVFLLLFWLLVTRSACLGFYDPAWMVCAAFSALALSRRRAPTALGWFTAAAFINYRAVCTLPMGLAATWRVIAGRSSPAKKAALLAVVSVIGLFTLHTFRLFLQSSPAPGTPTFEAATEPYMFRPEGVRTNFIWLAAVVVCVFAARARNWLVAVTVLAATVLTLKHGAHAWHSSILVAPVLIAAGARDKARLPSLYGALAAWCLVVFELGYGFEPTLYLGELVGYVRDLLNQ